MGLVEKLAEKLDICTFRIEGSPFIPIQNAEDFINICIDEGVKILGIEGFYYREKNLIPSMNLIADLSDIDSASESTEEALRFVRQIPNLEVLLDFTLDE